MGVFNRRERELWEGVCVLERKGLKGKVREVRVDKQREQNFSGLLFNCLKRESFSLIKKT